jgi:hypothetical protein
MKMEEVRGRARAAGLSAARSRKADLIRAIQVKEGNQACFGAAWRFECGQADCCWGADCRTPNPG